MFCKRLCSAFLIISIFLIEQGCAIQKRHYIKGFYFSGRNHNAKTISLPSPDINLSRIDDQESTYPKLPITVLAKEGIHEIVRFTVKSFPPIVSNSSCDTLVLVNGKMIQGKIVTQNSFSFSIKNCDGTGDAIKIPKAQIKEIKWTGGKPREIEEEKPEKGVTKKEISTPIHSRAKKLGAWSLLCFLLFILGVIISNLTWSLIAAFAVYGFFVLAISLAVMSLVCYRKSESKEGRWLAITTLILTGLLVLLFSGVFNGIVRF